MRRRSILAAVAAACAACGLLARGEDDGEGLPPRAAPEADAGEASAPGPGPDDAGSARDARAEAPIKHVFVTGARFDGALGGLAGADAKCAEAAAAAGLDGGYVAYLATTLTRASGRLDGGIRWVRRDGEVVFEADGGPPAGELPRVAIVVTEDGGIVPNSVFDNAWTGQALGTTFTCFDWTSADAAAFGGYGQPYRTDGTWHDTGGTSQDCAATLHLYCFER